MRDDGGDPVVIHIGRGVGIGEDVAAVEDVQPLVLHRAEVEIVDRDDVEHVEVVFAAVNVLVPFHRRLQRRHRVGSLGDVGGSDPDAEFDVAPAHRREPVVVRGQVTRDQREQIARFGERIAPFGPVAAFRGFATADMVAVRQQYRIGRSLGAHPYGVAAEHVGPVGEERDSPEPFRLALRA